jgi:hypothetical protein
MTVSMQYIYWSFGFFLLEASIDFPYCNIEEASRTCTVYEMLFICEVKKESKDIPVLN